MKNTLVLDSVHKRIYKRCFPKEYGFPLYFSWRIEFIKHTPTIQFTIVHGPVYSSMMPSLHPQVKLYIGILSISFFPIAFYFFSEKTHPLMAVFLLFLMVASLSSPAVIREVIDKGNPLRYLQRVLTLRVISILLLISAITILGNFLVIYALSHQLSPSVTQAILRSETVFVTLGGVLLFKEKYHRSLPWMITLIIIGFTVMGYEILTQRVWDWNDIYILYVLGAAICFGSFQILSKVIIHDLNIYLLNGLRSLMGCLILLPWVYPYFPELNGKTILFALLSALCGPFLGRNILLSCTRDLPLNYIGCNLSLTPILSLGLQWVFLHNLPTSYEMLGGGIILLSVLLFNLTPLISRTNQG